MAPRGLVVAVGSGLGISLLAFAAVLAIVDVWGESVQTPQAAATATPQALPFTAVPLDDDSAWTTKENESGAARLVIRQFGTELGYVRMGTSTSICAEVVDAHGAPVEGAHVAFVAHGQAAIEPTNALTNDVGSACASLTPHAGGSLHVQAIATKDGYEPASAGKVSEVVDASETTPGPAGANLTVPAVFAGVAGLVLLLGAALLTRGGVARRRLTEEIPSMRPSSSLRRS
ncbi:MAG: hypothetical protein HY556_11405 [Euryarchaeota archaeon]|nr:hypothetical protein [Euryarchaeota archaeon]